MVPNENKIRLKVIEGEKQQQHCVRKSVAEQKSCNLFVLFFHSIICQLAGNMKLTISQFHLPCQTNAGANELKLMELITS